MTDSCLEPQTYHKVRVLGLSSIICLQDDVDDRQLRHRDHQMKSGNESDDGFVTRNLKELYGVSFRPFGAILASKTTLMAVFSDTATSESKSEPGFVISSQFYLLGTIFKPF